MIREAHREPGPRWNVPLLQFGAATTLYRRGEWDDTLAEIAAALTSADEFGVVVRHGLAARDLQPDPRRSRRADPRLRMVATARRRDVPGNSVGMEWLLYTAAIHTEGQGDQQRALDTLRPVVHACIAAGAPAMLINLSPDTARLAAALGDDRLLRTVSANLAVIANNTASPMAHAYNNWVGAWFTGDHTDAAQAADSLHACGRHAEFARVTHDAAVFAQREPGRSPKLVGSRRERSLPTTPSVANHLHHAPARGDAHSGRRDASAASAPAADDGLGRPDDHRAPGRRARRRRHGERPDRRPAVRVASNGRVSSRSRVPEARLRDAPIS